MSIATLDHDCFAAASSDDEVDSDEALLRAFVTSRDDIAFAKVVSHHAGLVMGVCRRVIGSEQDAEDAFQATFLVLARKAGSLRNGKSLPAWLHKTAHRISLRVRANKVRRREQSLETEIMVEDKSSLHRIATDHERSALDEELNRLPDRYRLPLFLCCLEGKSRDEAAQQLGWSSGSLKGRLERGRQLLRRRLMLRGVSFAIALSLVMRTPSVAHAAVSPGIVASTVQAGVRYSAGQSPVGFVSPNAHHLANWSLQVMSITSAKFAVCTLLVIGTLTIGNSWTVAPAAADGKDGGAIVVQPASAMAPELTFVALFDDDQEERERDQPRRDSDQPREAQGLRRDSDRPREDETRRDSDRPRETEQRRADESRRDSFRPKTESEEVLYRMIVQLQREVAELRNALRSRDGQPRRDGGDQERGRDQLRRGPDAPRRESDRPRERDSDRPATSRDGARDSRTSRAARWQDTKEGKIFKAYDKNGDLKVSLEEWIAMKEGEMTDARYKLESDRFKDAEPSGDGKFSVEEFLHWYTKGRKQDAREGERRESSGR